VEAWSRFPHLFEGNRLRTAALSVPKTDRPHAVNVSLAESGKGDILLWASFRGQNPRRTIQLTIQLSKPNLFIQKKLLNKNKMPKQNVAKTFQHLKLESKATD
jgi:hypothetical protein